MIPTGASFSVVVPFHKRGRISRINGIRGLRFAKSLGQSAAIYYGLHACTGDHCGLMDGDGQNDPANFLPLLEEFHRGTADVVCGYRTDRHDSWDRKVASRLANGIRRAFLNDGVRDTGYSQKVFRREAVELLVPFRGMHWYLPRCSSTLGFASLKSGYNTAHAAPEPQSIIIGRVRSLGPTICSVSPGFFGADGRTPKY